MYPLESERKRTPSSTAVGSLSTPCGVAALLQSETDAAAAGVNVSASAAAMVRANATTARHNLIATGDTPYLDFCRRAVVTASVCRSPDTCRRRPGRSRTQSL